MKKLFLFALLTLTVLTAFAIAPVAGAHAEGIDIRSPNYSLYSEEEGLNLRGEITYDIGNFDPETFLISEHSEYTLKAPIGQTYNFSVPILCLPTSLPTFQVKINEKTVDCQTIYGNWPWKITDKVSFIDAYETRRTTRRDITAVGTLYTVTPTQDEFSVTLKKSDTQFMICQTLSSKESVNEDGSMTFIYQNSLDYYPFFASDGDFEIFEVTGGEYTEEKKSAKEFVDENYASFLDREDYPAIDFFYSMIGEEKGKLHDYTYMFYISLTDYTLVTFDFTVTTESETTVISYDKIAKADKNPNYSPWIYAIRHYNFMDCPVSYKVKMCEDYPYIAVRNLKAVKDKNGDYTVAETNGRFDFGFCSEKPTYLLKDDRPSALTILAILGISVAVTAFFVGIVAVVFKVKKAISSRR